jgi:signal transduction histidine kinase
MKILLVEDNLGDADLIGEALAETDPAQFELTHVERLGEALNYVAKAEVEVILLDLSLPDAHRLETLRRMQDAAPELPIVVLTGFDNEDFAAKLVRQGAQDYLVKGQVDGRLLTRTLRYAIERKQAEEELRQIGAELARSNAELERFAYVVSHDLQEPLRSVSSMLQLLQQRYAGQLDAHADKFIQLAVEGASRMKTLINDLLTFSRVGTHDQPFKPTDCAAILRDALANLAVAIQESRAVITHDRLPTVMADGTQLTQLFQNLIGNAIKFRGEDAPVIHLGVGSKEGECLFVVRDNGIGLEAQHFERIFGVFQRLHMPREYAGTGIGLAVCKKIVERHGGRIWVESEPGRGSTFYFTLKGDG